MSATQTHRYKELRLGQLRAFCECVRQKSFLGAARVLGMSHPAIWQQVRALEREFGVSLIQRHGRELQVSEDGQVLLELAGTVVAATDSLKEAFEERRRTVPRTLTVIGTAGVITEELARPIVDFCRRHSEIQLTLLSYAGTQMLDSLVAGDADMAILPVGMTAIGEQKLLSSEPLCARDACLAVPKKHPLALKRRITLADLVGYPLILPPRTGIWRPQIDDVFRRAGLLDQRRTLLEVSFIQAARRYVSLGLGVALLALPREGLRFPGIVIRPLDGLFPPEEIAILWRKGAAPRPQARLFADLALARLRTG